jgi:hypothetical protein
MMQRSGGLGRWMTVSTALEPTERRAVVQPCKKTISLYSNSPTYLILDLSKFNSYANFCRPMQTIKQSWKLIFIPHQIRLQGILIMLCFIILYYVILYYVILYYIHGCTVYLDITKVPSIYTNGCTIYLLRSTLKFTLKLLLHVSV